MSWMTQTEAAAALRCSNRTIRRRIRAGTLKTRREGRNILVDVDTDHAMATVTQVGRQLAEVGAAAAIQKKHDSDTFSAMQATFTDTLSALSASHELLDRQTIVTRRSARAGWMTAVALTIALFVGGWFYNAERMTYSDERHELQATLTAAQADSETALISAEVRHVGELATTRARLESATETMEQTLAYERSRAADLEGQIAAASRTLAEETARGDAAAADHRRLLRDLQRASAAADLSATLRSVWMVARSALSDTPDPEQLRALRAELAALAARHAHEIDAARARHESDLAAAKARYDGESETLRAALDHERKAVGQLEQRAETFADKLVTAVLERGQLQLERQQLLEERRRLQDDLRTTRMAADLSADFSTWWSLVLTALQPAEGEPGAQRLSSTR